MAIGLYGPEGLQWAGGGSAAGVHVFVFLPGTTTKAPLFLDDEAEFSAANPVLSDQLGRIAFYAEQGAYDLVINSTRFAINISDNVGDPPPMLRQLGDVVVTDPTDGQSLVWDEGTGRWRNETIAGGTIPPEYLTQTEGDARYYTQTQVDDIIAGLENAAQYPIAGKVFCPDDYGAVGDGIADDHAAVLAAWNAAWAWLQAAPTVQEPYRGECTLYIPWGRHYRIDTSIGSRLLTTDQARAILPIPMISRSTSNKKTLRIMGAGEHYLIRPAELGGTPAQIKPPCSIFFDSGATVHTWSNTLGLPCGIGATDSDMTDFEGNTFSNVHITIQDLTIVQNDNPSLFAINLEQCSTARIERVRGAIVSVLDNAPLCTNKTGGFLLLPRSNNNIAITVRDLIVEGCFTGIPMAEHAYVDNAVALRCVIGLVNRRPNSHHSLMNMIKIEQCLYGLAGYNPANEGARSAYGWSGEISFIDFEDYAYSGLVPVAEDFYAPVYPGAHFWDESNVITALIKVDRVNSEAAPPAGIGVAPFGESNTAYVRGTANKIALWDRKMETPTTRLSNDPTPPIDPISLFGAIAGTDTVFENGGNPICMGMEWRVTGAGSLIGLRYRRADATMSATPTGKVYRVSDQAEVASLTFAAGSSIGWIEGMLVAPFELVVNEEYIVQVRMPNGIYTATTSYWDSGAGATGRTSGIIRAENNNDITAPTPSQGNFREGAHGFPNGNGNGANYWVDVIVQPAA